MRAVNHLADRLLALVVPRATASAATCFTRRACTVTTCSAPYVKWENHYRCCQGNMGGTSCTYLGTYCSCYLG